MDESATKLKIAAVGDIHVQEHDKGKWTEFFLEISKEAGVLCIAGDLTYSGIVEEAHTLGEELKACPIPVVAVMGNHDYDRGFAHEIASAIRSERVHVLEGTSCVIEGVGFAGIKGFGGGFDQKMLSTMGENLIKDFVRMTVNDALKLDEELARLELEFKIQKKVVLLHYSPIRATVVGEPEEIFPFLGCSRLAEPINRRNVSVVFHGHAHHGTVEGRTSKEIPVFNVSKTLLEGQTGKGWYSFEL